MKRDYQALIYRLQQRVVVWIVLTVVLDILAALHIIVFIKYVAWIATAYTCLLILLWIFLVIQQIRRK